MNTAPERLQIKKGPKLGSRIFLNAKYKYTLSKPRRRRASDPSVSQESNTPHIPPLGSSLGIFRSPHKSQTMEAVLSPTPAPGDDAHRAH